MKRALTTAAWFAAAQIAIVLGGAAILQSAAIGGASAHDAANVTQIFARQLANVPGNSMTALVVEYAPGGKSDSHHHTGSVFAYVLEGEIRSQISDGQPAQVYKAGEYFYEPPGSSHLVSENASATRPAKLLAVFVAADDAVLTAPGVNN